MRLYGRVADALNAAEQTFLLAPPFDAYVPDVTGEVPYRPIQEEEEDPLPQTTDSAYPA